MNGRLSKVDMTARLLKLKRDIDSKAWYPDWNSKERWAAQHVTEDTTLRFANSICCDNCYSYYG